MRVRRQRLTMLSAVCISGAILATDSSAIIGRPNDGRFHLGSEVVFYDDFSGPELDRSKWNIVMNGQTVNNEQQAYIDSKDVVYVAQGDEAVDSGTGVLVIHPRYRVGFANSEGRTFDFVSGRLDTKGKIEFAYGTVAARIKLTAASGFWPAFWLLGTGRWPDTGEIDIMENVGEPDWVSVALHGPGYSGSTPLQKRHHFARGIDATRWHVYSVDWIRDGMTFKIDDELVYRVTRGAVEQYGPWSYDNPKYIILNVALGGSYPRALNRVDSPYVGIPQSTVDLIKAGRVRMLIDWVRVTK